MMKLLSTPTSPYARKPRIVLFEKSIDCEVVTAIPWDDDPIVLAHSPLRKIPVLLTDAVAGGALRGSPVIAEYLDAASPPPRFVPADVAARAACRSREALAEGALDAATAIIMAARVAPDADGNDPKNCPWIAWQVNKINKTLDYFEIDLAARAPDAFDMSDIGLVCLLTFLARLPRVDGWEKSRPNLARWQARVGERESVARTAA